VNTPGPPDSPSATSPAPVDPSSLDPTPGLARARDLVLRHGWNSTCYQILNPGLNHWFDPGRPAVVGFVRRDGYWVAAGAPVCAADHLPAVSTAFERAAAAAGCRVCYLGAQDRLRQTHEWRADHAVVTVGAQPVWDPREWAAAAGRHRSVRSQLNRARNKGVAVTAWDSRRARADAGVRRCLREWLAAKPMPPMHFMVEPDVLDGEVADRAVVVAEVGGRVAGFAVASPVPGRGGYLIEEVARAPWAPNGTAEVLIDGCMRRLADAGSGYVTLGLVALARNAGPGMARNPMWLRVAFGWARAHGRRFYNFEGLERFREKMRPAGWEPVYAVANSRPFPPAALWAIAGAFCDGSPVRALAASTVKAVRQEARWAADRWRARGGRA
jgi:phosphatidylglycerol lysyltransferase